MGSFTTHRYGTKMKNYQPPTTSVLDAMIGDGPDAETSPEAKELERIHHEWRSLDISTQENLLTFEKPGFQLPDRVVGVQAVKDLVSSMSHPTRNILIPIVSSGTLMTS
jgi:predicted GTPase